jgi:hypothetical protein
VNVSWEYVIECGKPELWLRTDLGGKPANAYAKVLVAHIEELRHRLGVIHDAVKAVTPD